MLNFIIGLLQAAGLVRRQIKARITLFCLHFAGLILIHCVIQFNRKQWLDPYNAFFGNALVAGLALLLWVRGGPWFDLLIGRYVFSEDLLARRLSRVLFGFLTIESGLNIFFTIFPVYPSLGGFGLLLTAVVSYILFRHMAGEAINWKNWIWLPKFATGIAFFVLVVSLLRQKIGNWVDFWESLDLTDPDTWVVIAGILLALAVVSYLFDKSRGSTVQPSTTNHGGSHDH